MKNTEFVAKLKDVAQNYRTAYMWGTYGNKITESLISRKSKQYPLRYSSSRKALLRGEIGTGAWGFDCCGLIKGILWGWEGDSSKNSGGAAYASNGVPDKAATSMFNMCKEISTDFSNIESGEAVWTTGHIGVYVGDGKVVEATLRGSLDGVVITNLSDYKWKKHGRLPFIDYKVEAVKKSVAEIAQEVLDGKWGNGSERKKRLAEAGYNYSEVQAKVNEILYAPKKKSVEEIAREVINGKWGNGSARKKKLAEAGYDAAEVQKMVNKIIYG